MVTNKKLINATTTPSSVLSGKTFYAGDKILKTGTLGSKGAESVTLNAGTPSYTFGTSGKYCTGNMAVNTNTKAAETVTLNASTTSKTFDTSGKLCTGNMVVNTSTMAGSSVTLNASTTGYTFGTSGKLCTGNMSVSTSTKGAESKSFTPSGSAQSYTFATSGKLCTGNMVATVSASTNWPLRWISKGLYSTFETTTTLDVADGDGTYVLYVGWQMKNSDNGYGAFGELKFQGTTLVSASGSQSGYSGPFTFNITSSNKTLTYRWYYSGYQQFIYRRIA